MTTDGHIRALDLDLDYELRSSIYQVDLAYVRSNNILQKILEVIR